jgi:hypothetical protein
MFLYYLGVVCSGGDAEVTRRAVSVLRREVAGSKGDAIVGGFGLLVSTAGGFGLLGSAAAADGNVSLLTTVR